MTTMTTALRWLSPLIMLWALALPVRADSTADTRQLLEWVGALALLEQAQPVAQLVIDNELAQQPPPSRSQQQQRELLKRFETAPLQQALVRHIAARLQPEQLAQLQALLQQPLAKRVRFFERALTQQNVDREWQRWREETPAPAPARLELLRAIDAAAHDSRLAAHLQTAVETAVRTRFGSGDVSLQAEAQREREKHLQAFTEQYLLYAYRYLRDDELRQYAELLQNAALQQLLDQIGEGVAIVVADAAK